MIICYLLESTELCGGVRVVFDQARLLIARGHQVIIRARIGNHSWYHHKVNIHYVNDLATSFTDIIPDIVIATFWTTVKSAITLNCATTLHFCQGYEGDFIEYAAIKHDIETAYRQPITKLTLGQWMTERLHTVYGRSCFPIYTVGQIIDTQLFTPDFFPVLKPIRRFFKRPTRILLLGMFEASVKGIPNALNAIKIARNQDIKIHVTRVSSYPISQAEKDITPINCYLSNLTPDKIAKLYCNHDLMLAPSLEQEGFGLPFAEALASGLPCVATSISSHLSFDKLPDYAIFVPPSNPNKMANAIVSLTKNHRQLSFLQQRGPKLIRQAFSDDQLIERLEYIFLNPST